MPAENLAEFNERRNTEPYLPTGVEYEAPVAERGADGVNPEGEEFGEEPEEVTEPESESEPEPEQDGLDLGELLQ